VKEAGQKMQCKVHWHKEKASPTYFICKFTVFSSSTDISATTA